MKTQWLAVWLGWVVGLGWPTGPVTAADTNAGVQVYIGEMAELGPVFSDILLVTNPPAAVTNSGRYKSFVEPRLVSNTVPPVWRRSFETTPANPKPGTLGGGWRTNAGPPGSGRPSGTAAASTKPRGSDLSRSMESLDNTKDIRVGDRLTFRVLEDQEEPKLLTVTDAGELDVPELGLVMASKKTCKQLAYEIKAKLEQTKYYHATVVVGIDRLNPTASGRRVYVEGEVQRPGVQEIPGGGSWTVTKAILRAGGFKQFANKGAVKLTRAGQNGAPSRIYTVDVAAVLEKGRTDKDLVVEAEDMIYVPELVIKWH